MTENGLKLNETKKGERNGETKFFPDINFLFFQNKIEFKRIKKKKMKCFTLTKTND